MGGMAVHRRVPPSIKFESSHLYTWVDRGTGRVKCLAQEHNTMSLVRAYIHTYPLFKHDGSLNPDRSIPGDGERAITTFNIYV